MRVDGWMDLDMGEDGGGRRERDETRLNDASRLFAPHLQIRQFFKVRPPTRYLQSPNLWLFFTTKK